MTQTPYLFICQWISRLPPCPSYCKQCCSEHWVTCVSFDPASILLPSCVCPAVRFLSHRTEAVLFPVFQGISTLFSIVTILVCIPTKIVRGFLYLCTLSSIHKLLLGASYISLLNANSKSPLQVNETKKARSEVSGSKENRKGV